RGLQNFDLRLSKSRPAMQLYLSSQSPHNFNIFTDKLLIIGEYIISLFYEYFNLLTAKKSRP
ncbi:MAG: hypothetical protein II370_05720, partial [Clostridia bacterium]|nr:hypothetical protein [Clostridia bacterium]